MTHYVGLDVSQKTTAICVVESMHQFWQVLSFCNVVLRPKGLSHDRPVLAPMKCALVPDFPHFEELRHIAAL